MKFVENPRIFLWSVCLPGLSTLKIVEIRGNSWEILGFSRKIQRFSRNRRKIVEILPMKIVEIRGILP